MEDVEPTKSAITFTVLLIGWLVQCCHQRRGTASVGSYNSTILVGDCFSNLVNEHGTTYEQPLEACDLVRSSYGLY